jgi:branched-chain amino acid transport system substrate-binding protein
MPGEIATTENRRTHPHRPAAAPGWADLPLELPEVADDVADDIEGNGYKIMGPQRSAGQRLLLRLGVTTAGAALLMTAACGSGSDTKSGASAGSTADAALLGPKNVATGAPVKIGVVSDGRTAAFDNSVQLRAAAAIVKYLNEHRGGIGGRPVSLVTCETAGDPGKASDCAAQLVQANVVATVTGETTAAATLQKEMHKARIPFFNYANAEQAILLDKDSSFTLGDPTAGLSDLPIRVAKEHKLTTVNAVVIDVPAATGFYKAVGAGIFRQAGIKLNLVAIPPGQADMTPQMTRIASGGPSEVQIVGNDSFCIAAINGLRAANFDGAISVVNQCVTDSARKALGGNLKGVVMGTPSPLGDGSDPGLRQFQAIVDTYAKAQVDTANALSLNTYITMMSFREALDGLHGDVTPATIISTIKAMPEKPIPGGGGLRYRCNGKANPLAPGVCARGSLRTTLDAKGQPTLPYTKTNTSPIGD